MAQPERRRILFVGGIAPNISENSLFLHFSQFCALTKVKVMREKKTRESKGYAYITVADPKSIPLLTSTDHYFFGRKLDIQLATSKGEKREWKASQRGKRVYAMGLSPGTTNEQVVTAFQRFGEVRNAFIIREHESRIKREYAYVQFEEVTSADSALRSLIQINGKVITCQPYWSRHGQQDSKNTSYGRATNSDGDRVVPKKLYSTKQSCQGEQSSSKNFGTRVTQPTKQQHRTLLREPIKYQEDLAIHAKMANNSPSNYRFNIIVKALNTTRMQ
jgi:RNA recognition motif-containing protein